MEWGWKDRLLDPICCVDFRVVYVKMKFRTHTIPGQEFIHFKFDAISFFCVSNETH